MSPKPIPAEPIRNPIGRLTVLGISSGLGLGYAPIAPGTFGSLLGIPAGLALLHFHPELALGICVAALALFSWLADRACRHWGDMDAGRVVSDEVLGQAISIYGLRGIADPETGLPHWTWILAAFLLFRIFDIVKPYPAKTFDRQASGFGVVLDDVVCGLYVGIFLMGISKIAHGFF